ncbi:RagB/SusD family nutrient uptake outer membrane protein [Prolixibacteraceae bacterium JC049]|nr:RagB/SusD family nutrient uptake outer membrane protein [Prolixibacteraceae bacterium JC049]
MKKLIYILLGALLFVSCEDELNLSSKTNLSDSTFWLTVSDFEKAANNFYGSIGGVGSYSDENSDLSYGNGTNTVSAGTFLAPESDNTWNGNYSTIRGTNTFLEKAEAATIKDDIKRYVAEVKWFRALAYYRLVERFGDVPLITKALDLNSEELYGSRSPRTQVIDFVLSELETAAADLPKQSQLSANEIGRITQGAAYALKARVALFEGTWSKYHNGDKADERLQKAIDAAKKVMDSNEYGMFVYAANPEHSYRYQAIEEGNDSKEQIVARRYHSEDGPGHAIQHWIAHGGSYDPTKKLADMYLCTDGLPISKSDLFKGRDKMTTEFENRDPRMWNTIAKPGVHMKTRDDHDGAKAKYPDKGQHQGLYFPYKYCSEFVPGYSWGKSEFFYRLIRYPEVLLIYAEAIFEKNGSITDEQLEESVNVIRGRVNMPDLTNAFVTSNSLDMKTEIRRERSIELALEGFRLHDLRRWKTAEVELAQPIKGVKYTGTEFETVTDDAGARRYDTAYKLDADGFIIVDRADNRKWAAGNDKLYLFPLPTKQLLLNENLKQNPGW